MTISSAVGIGRSTAGTVPRARSPLTARADQILIIAALGLTFVTHAQFVVNRNINWDEFFLLALVYDHARGALVNPLQSAHVHVFSWLTTINGQEVEQVIAARATLLLLLLGTCVCVYLLARRVASVSGALFAVLCCASYSNIVIHGTAFRRDGISVFLLMTALVLAQTNVRRVLALSASAILVSAALLVTIKSVFYLPVFALQVIVPRWQGWRSHKAYREGLLVLSVLTVTTLSLYFLHRGVAVATVQPDSVAYLESSASRAIRRDVFFPGFIYFIGSVFRNIVQWACLVYGFVVLGRRLRAKQHVAEATSLLALTSPLLSLLFYRNAFPYFYVFLMPSALVLCAVAFDELAHHQSFGDRRGLPLTLVATAGLVGTVISCLSLLPSESTTAQRTVIRAVHDIFPQPVPYIDRNSMIASFPKVGFFMSTWGLETYRDAGRPVFASLLRARGPRFLVTNSPALSSVFVEEGVPEENGQQLMAEDRSVLRNQFIHYWGPVYVAGHSMSLAPGAEASWDVLLPGQYRLRSDGPVIIGGSEYAPGSTLDLPSGNVSLQSSIRQEIVLQTTSARKIPPYPPPTGPLYADF